MRSAVLGVLVEPEAEGVLDDAGDEAPRASREDSRSLVWPENCGSFMRNDST